MGDIRQIIEESRRQRKEAFEIVKANPRLRPYLEAIKRARPKISDKMLEDTAICMENTRQWMRSLNETTKSSSIGNFIHHGFELIAAVMPNLLAHEYVSVQPMTRRVGELFFLDYKYGTTKGNITAGTTLFGWQQAGQGGEQYYSSPKVRNELVGTGNGATKHYEYTLNTIPVDSLVSITDGTEIFTDTTKSGTLTGDKTGTGSIDYDTGEVVLDFHSNVTNLIPIYANYDLNFENNPDNIPEVNLEVSGATVTAEEKKLRAIYTLDAAYDMEQSHGRSVDADLSNALSSTVRAEIDAKIFAELYAGAHEAITTWNRNTPLGVNWRDHKFSLISTIKAASNQILKNTRRVEGNFIVAGVDVCTVIEDLEGRFRRTAAKAMPGPHLIGTLDDMPVVKNPYFSDKTFLVGYKGDSMVDTGYIYAPYMPLYATPKVTLDDFKTRQGMGTRFATYLVNGRMYIRGAISGDNVPTPYTITEQT